jgi:hypothetical protein
MHFSAAFKHHFLSHLISMLWKPHGYWLAEHVNFHGTFYATHNLRFNHAENQAISCKLDKHLVETLLDLRLFC